MSTQLDLVAAQDTVVGLLLSDDRLADVAITSYRKMRLNSELNYLSMLSVGRGGGDPGTKRGLGMLVLMPRAVGKNKNVSGPVLDWVIDVITAEEPRINFDPTIGTMVSAEQAMQTLLDIAHNYYDERFGTFQVDADAADMDEQYVPKGCLGYRTSLHLSAGKTVQSSRVAPVAVTVDGVALVGSSVAAGSMVLTCATSGSAVRYTLDGGYPGADISGQGADYLTPVALVAGQTVRAAAYKSGMVSSPARYFVVT